MAAGIWLQFFLLEPTETASNPSSTRRSSDTALIPAIRGRTVILFGKVLPLQLWNHALLSLNIFILYLLKEFF